MAGVVKNSIVPHKIKSMDLRFRWLCFRMVQGQFRFYWDPYHLSSGGYRMKRHPTA